MSKQQLNHKSYQNCLNLMLTLNTRKTDFLIPNFFYFFFGSFITFTYIYISHQALFLAVQCVVQKIETKQVRLHINRVDFHLEIDQLSGLLISGQQKLEPPRSCTKRHCQYKVVQVHGSGVLGTR